MSMGRIQMPTVKEKSTGLVNKLEVTKQGQLRLYAVWVYTTTAQFIQIFDRTAVPVDGTEPDLIPVDVQANRFNYFEFPNGIPMSNGIAISNSTSAETLTAGAADCMILALFA